MSSVCPPGRARRPVAPSFLVALTATLAVGAPMLAGAAGPPPAAGADTTAGAIERALEGFSFRPIGPAVMGGRIADIAAVDGDTWYVAAATGGLWKTSNRGTTWEELFAHEAVNSIGDVAVAPSDPRIVYVGTGEANNRQSSPWGAGVYRSDDGGRTWVLRGLENTRHVGRIIVHPSDPDTLWVAAAGNLWAASEERGVYRTRDGGDSWQRVLFVDADTGAIDLAIDPQDPDTLIAAMYQRRRSACCFIGGGPGSGLYRTRDGGDRWEPLTEGLPAGDKGRIGVDFFRGDGRIVYAVVEAVEGSGVYRSLDGGSTWQMRSDTNPRPIYFSQIRVDPVDSQRVYLLGQLLYVSDDGGAEFSDDGAPNVHLDHHALWIDPDNPRQLVLGSDGGVSVSFDRGRNWRFLDNLPIGQFYEIGVDDEEPYHVYGGLQDNGTWAGPSATLDTRGIRNADWFNVAGGDGFYVRVDPTDANVVYAESQNGNVTRFDPRTRERQAIRPIARPDRERVARWQERDEQATAAAGRAAAASTPVGAAAQRGGGDTAASGRADGYRWNWNAPMLVSRHHPGRLILGANVVLVSDDRGISWREASPDLTLAIDRDEQVLMGMRPVPGVLSRNDGIAAYGTITTLSESPVRAGVLYAGTDDGRIQRTLDDGVTWTDVTPRLPGLPERPVVSRVVASVVPGRVYATLDDHFHGDFDPYVLVSEDEGERWRPIVKGLPGWSVNVVYEHPRSPELLLLGNELGLYVSFDAGARWRRFDGGLPTVPVDDLLVHPRTGDLVVATHGRGIWILDDASPLLELAAAVREPAALFDVRPVRLRNLYAPQEWTGAAEFRAPNPPSGAIIRYWLSEQAAAALAQATGSAVPRAPAGEGDGPGPATAGAPGGAAGAAPARVRLVIGTAGSTVRTLEGPAEPGLHRLVWDLRTDPPVPASEQEGERGGRFGRPPGIRVPPGSYTIALQSPGGALRTSVQVALDPRVHVDPADLQLRQLAMRRVWEFTRPFARATLAVARLGDQAGAARQLIERAGASAQLRQQARELEEEVNRLRGRLNGFRRVLFAAFAIERVTARPTDDQLHQIDGARAELPGLIEAINALIVDRLPALYAQMDAESVHPDPGEPLEVPRWQR